MFEIIFLWILALIWMIFAVVQDIRTREIANWLNFSLIVVALGFRFFYSLFYNDFGFLYQGLLGLGIFFILGNVLYYGRFFAGGDAKLMISLGTILPFTSIFSFNFKIFVYFIFIFFLVGALYTLICSGLIGLFNFKKLKKELGRQFLKNKKLIYIGFGFAIFLLILSFFESLFFLLAIFIFILSYLFIYVKAVDESCLIKGVESKNLTEGDWLYRNVKLKKEIIKKNWNGLSEEDIRKIRREKKRILIKYGIPFSPVFLISFLILIYLFYTDSLYSLLNLLGNSLG